MLDPIIELLHNQTPDFESDPQNSTYYSARHKFTSLKTKRSQNYKKYIAVKRDR